MSLSLLNTAASRPFPGRTVDRAASATTWHSIQRMGPAVPTRDVAAHRLGYVDVRSIAWIGRLCALFDYARGGPA